MPETFIKFISDRPIAAVVVIGSISVGPVSDSEITFGGAFEFDSASTKTSGATTETANDLSKIEVVINTTIDEQLSYSLTLEAADSDDDEDATVDDSVNVASATLSLAPKESQVEITVGLDTGPVGQFSTLSASDPLALAEFETKVRGLFLEYGLSDASSISLFSGSQDDSTGDNLWGANFALEVGGASLNFGYFSETAGDIDESATTAAINYPFGNLTAIYEHVGYGAF